MLDFQVVLADCGGFPDQKTALVSNPLDPTKWSDLAAEQFDVPFDWLDQPQYGQTFEVARERISNVMRTYCDIYRPKELHRIMDSVFDKHGIGENERIPAELMKPILGESFERAARYTLGIPFEEAVNEDEVRKVFIPSIKSDI